MYVYVSVCSSSFLTSRLQWHVVCCIHTILVYRCNKILFYLLVNCLRVDWIDCLYVSRVFFDCVSHQRCTVVLNCDSSVSEWTCFQRGKKGFFHFFFKKWDFFFKKKWSDVKPDERLTSDVRRQTHPTWRTDIRWDNKVSLYLSLYWFIINNKVSGPTLNWSVPVQLSWRVSFTKCYSKG